MASDNVVVVMFEFTNITVGKSRLSEVTLCKDYGAVIPTEVTSNGCISVVAQTIADLFNHPTNDVILSSRIVYSRMGVVEWSSAYHGAVALAKKYNELFPDVTPINLSDFDALKQETK